MLGPRDPRAARRGERGSRHDAEDLRFEGACGEQRVREADPTALGLDDASLESRGETHVALDTGRGLRDRDRRVGMRRSGYQEVPALGRQCKEATVDEVVEGVGHPQRLAGLD